MRWLSGAADVLGAELAGRSDAPSVSAVGWIVWPLNRPGVSPEVSPGPPRSSQTAKSSAKAATSAIAAVSPRFRSTVQSLVRPDRLLALGMQPDKRTNVPFLLTTG